MPVPEFPEEAGDTTASVTVRSSASKAVPAHKNPPKPLEPAATTVASAPEWETVGPDREVADGSDSASNPWLNQHGGGNKVRQKRRMGEGKREGAAVLGLGQAASKSSDNDKGSAEDSKEDDAQVADEQEVRRHVH